jgi:hypothetical protein
MRVDIVTRFWCRYLREGDHLADPGVDGRIILKRSSRREMGYGLD